MGINYSLIHNAVFIILIFISNRMHFYNIFAEVQSMKRFWCAGLVICLLLSLTACGKKKKDLTAAIRFYSVFDSSWDVYIPEDEEDDNVQVEEKKPEYEAVLLKEGDDIESDIYVKTINDKAIMIAFDPHYIAYIYDVETEIFLRQAGENGSFLLKPGEKAVMYDTGICDASYTVYLILDEIR